MDALLPGRHAFPRRLVQAPPTHPARLLFLAALRAAPAALLRETDFPRTGSAVAHSGVKQPAQPFNMEDAAGDAAPAAAAPGRAPAAVEAVDEGDVRGGIADDGDGGAAADSEPEPEEAEGGLSAAGAGVVHGPHRGADLSQDAIADLRARHKRLKAEQKRVRQEMKNKARKRQRVLARMRHVDAASVLQVLLERGVNLGDAAGARPAAPAPPAAPAGEGA